MFVAAIVLSNISTDKTTENFKALEDFLTRSTTQLYVVRVLLFVEYTLKKKSGSKKGSKRGFS